MDQAITGSATALARKVSVFGLWLLVVNGMIGAGIFGTPQEAARLAGEFSPWIFIFCGVLAAPVILCFAQLASYFDGAGGPLAYASAAFGPFVAFQVGWLLYLARLTAFAANANLLVTSLGYFAPQIVTPEMRVVLLFAICCLFAALNLFGTASAVRSLGLVTIFKFLALVAFIIIGGALVTLNGQAGSQAEVFNFQPDYGAAIILVIYAYTGFESGLIAAADAIHPKRDMPRALIAGLVTCGIIYCAAQWVYVTARAQGASGSLVEVAGVIMGPMGIALLTCGVIASVGGNLLSNMFAVPRLTYRLAHDGQLPQWFGRLSATYQTPSRSILFLATAAFLLASSGGYVFLAGLSVLMRIPVWICCVVALPRIAAKFGPTPNALVLPGGPALPVLSVLVCLGLLSQIKLLDFLSATGLVLVGSVLFFLARVERARSRDKA
jgi:amino acid transporter